MTDEKMSDDEMWAHFDVLRKYFMHPGRGSIADAVESREKIKASLDALSVLPRNLIVRWSDPNYG